MFNSRVPAPGHRCKRDFRQLHLFRDRLPHRPYCTDDPRRYGQVIRPADQARRKRYIQPNPPTLAFWLLYDVDKPGAAYSWEDAKVAAPHYAVVNPETSHAHYWYALQVPVVKVNGRKAAKYAAAVEHAYRNALGADASYSGHLAMNPEHPEWRTLLGGFWPYDLDELSDFPGVNLQRVDLRRKIPEMGLGRNVALFDRVRRWAYGQVDEYRNISSTLELFQEAVQARAEEINGNFGTPLPFPEVKATSKSVARWTWNRYHGKAESDRQFSERQARRGAAKGAAGRARIHQALQEARQGDLFQTNAPTAREIAETAGVSMRTVQRHAAKPREEYEREALETLKPWEALGMSRATWYRRGKPEQRAGTPC